MTYTPVTVERFGGLNLVQDPSEVGLGAAVDCLNVDFDLDGRVRTRSGTARFDVTAMSGATNVGLAAVNLGSPYLLAVSYTTPNVYLDRYSSAGVRTVVGNWGGTRANSIVNFGTPTASYAFIAGIGAGGGTNFTLRRYDGTTLVTSTGSPGYVAVVPTSNRLAQAHFTTAASSPSGANGSPSTVFFSDAGAPETYGANNYVHLHPGDGERITHMVTWRELLFVFKETKMFVFYAESTDASGNPVFNYRHVELPGPVGSVSEPLAVDVGLRGVYIISRNGVFRTNGETPVRISDKISSLFAGTFDGLPAILSVVNERVFVYDTANDFRTLVYDEATGHWTIWSATSEYWVAFPAADSSPYDGRALFFASGANIYKMHRATAPGAMTAFYQSGFSDLGTPGEKIIRQTQVWGYGTPSLAIAKDYGTPDTAAALTLGAAPAVDDAYDRTSRKGELFAFKLSATSGAWQANRVSFHTHSYRQPGMKG